MNEILELNTLVSLNFQVGDMQKIKISPLGEVVGVDGRQFNIDGNAVIVNTKKIGIDIALNENHWGSKAFGWFDLNSLELKEDGLYAALELNDLGKPVVENKHYRYLSPEYMVDQNRNVISIVGVGLVNQPNLLNKALNKKDDLKKTKKEDEKMTDKEQIEDLKKQNNTLSTQVAEANAIIASLNDNLKVTKVNNAIAGGTMLPANKDFALGLEVNQIDGYIATLNVKPKVDDLQEELNVQENNNTNTTAETTVFAQLGLGA